MTQHLPAWDSKGGIRSWERGNNSRAACIRARPPPSLTRSFVPTTSRQGYYSGLQLVNQEIPYRALELPLMIPHEGRDSSPWHGFRTGPAAAPPSPDPRVRPLTCSNVQRLVVDNQLNTVQAQCTVRSGRIPGEREIGDIAKSILSIRGRTATRREAPEAHDLCAPPGVLALSQHAPRREEGP